MNDIAVLFARADSIYKSLPGCDVYDIDRNALTYRGDLPIVAHPPCRAWGALRKFAKPRFGERKLAIWSVLHIRRNGGVLEHPNASRLWPTMNLPAPGARDIFGGYTLPIDQDWFGHRAEKRTRLYIVGCEPRDLPAFPISLEEPTHCVAQSARRQKLRLTPEITKPEREATPPQLAIWLCEIARRCRMHGAAT